MKRVQLLSLVFLLIAWSVTAHASVIVYKTFADYNNKIGVTYDDYERGVIQSGYLNMTLSKGGIEEKVKCKDIWGFTYSDKLFRINEVGLPIMLVSSGKIFYWENGVAHMEAIRKNREFAYVNGGFLNFLSKDLNSEILTLTPHMGQVKKETEAFIASYPESAPLFTCIGKITELERTRQCVQDFQK